MNHNKMLAFFSVIFLSGLLSSLFFNIAYGMNLINLYDTLVLPDKAECSKYQFYAIGQTGIATKSYDECSSVENVLRIWNKEQNSLKMLEGLSADTQIGQLRTRLNSNDDGTRGHFKVCGDFDVDFAGHFGGWLYFNKQFFFNFELPVYSMQLKNVKWTDLTQNVNADDFRVKEYLTNNFAQNVKELGCLDICGWKRTGVGDLALMFGWVGDFPQPKKVLKDVKLNVRLGCTAPTGLQADEDKIFAFPFGSDGSAAPFLGAGMDLAFGNHTRAGLDVQMVYPFGKTKCRRIKTNTCQTDLLFLTKTETYKSYGLTQRFNLYFEVYGGGFSFKPGYQFLKKGEDTLYICSNKFFDDVANSAESLQDVTMHNIILDLSYHLWTNRGSCKCSDCCGKKGSGYSDCSSCSCCSCNSCKSKSFDSSSKDSSLDGDSSEKKLESEESCSDEKCACKKCGCQDCNCEDCGCQDCKKKSQRFDCCECEHKVHPYIGLFAKIPFNGTRAATESTVGLTLAIDF